ncbi:unnamed protein product [Lepeophtheirus salmonis]|uniref:(salmon louse) hypothetical protein n=1 Tax=Lepeophtheirus salmonis TaxID=72036 RepID=A0A7R8CY51_LEPSM|nr:unnamed protein product [Lepeophtheirus salmonis]CAF2966947.1 unnamed protein product [Lepeophtheirus salmonis]
MSREATSLCQYLPDEKHYSREDFGRFEKSIEEKNVVQWAIFIGGVDYTFTVTAEFVDLVPMMDTTIAKDIFVSAVAALDRVGVDWSRAVSIATNGTPSMIKKRKCRHKVKIESEWLQDLTFLVDISGHMDSLNKMLQGRKKVVTLFHDKKKKAFKLKLALWEIQIESGDPAHFTCLRNVCEERPNTELKRYRDKIAGLLADFNKRFQVLVSLRQNFQFFSLPFIVKAINLPVDIQLELFDLQCDIYLKDKFNFVGQDKFY